MTTTRGIVQDLQLNRKVGKVQINVVGDPIYHTFHLYADKSVSMIDPTEMVRRNWMIGLLQHALTHGLDVSIEHPSKADTNVDGVTLHSTGRHYDQGPASVSTKGTVRKIRLSNRVGQVTIQNLVLKKGQAPGATPGEFVSISVEKLVDHYFYIYKDEGLPIIHPRELARRNQVVALLQQALADELEVTIAHAAETSAFVADVTLHTKE